MLYIYCIYNKNKIKFTAYKLQVIVQNSLINNHLAFAKNFTSLSFAYCSLNVFTEDLPCSSDFAKGKVFNCGIVFNDGIVKVIK